MKKLLLLLLAVFAINCGEAQTYDAKDFATASKSMIGTEVPAGRISNVFAGKDNTLVYNYKVNANHVAAFSNMFKDSNARSFDRNNRIQELKRLGASRTFKTNKVHITYQYYTLSGTFIGAHKIKYWEL